MGPPGVEHGFTARQAVVLTDRLWARAVSPARDEIRRRICNPASVCHLLACAKEFENVVFLKAIFVSFKAKLPQF